MSRYKVVGKPWEAKGAINVEDCTTSAEVMEKARLNFKVAKCELVAKMPFMKDGVTDDKLDLLSEELKQGISFIKDTNVYRNCPNAYATYRTDVNIPLGNVKSKYEVVQNETAFKFFDDAIGKDKAIWQTAGAFGNGEKIFVSAKLPDNIRVKGDIVENYLVFANSHDGSCGVNILFTPIRIVCQNTLNAALRSAECFIRFRHTQSVHGKITTAQEILGITKKKTVEVEQIYNNLANIKIDDNKAMEFFALTYLTNDEFDRVKTIDKDNGIKKLFYRNGQFIDDAKISTRKVNVLTNTMDYYISGPGQEEFRGTKWGAYNAVTGYYSNVANLEGLKRMDSLLYGNASKITQDALNLIFE